MRREREYKYEVSVPNSWEVSAAVHRAEVAMRRECSPADPNTREAENTGTGQGGQMSSHKKVREQHIIFFMQIQCLGTQDKITEKISDISNILLNLRKCHTAKKGHRT